MSSNQAPEKDALRRAASVLGGQSALASACGYSDRRSIWPYFNSERRFPAEHCPAIERATRALGDPHKIVTCEELRPDVAWEVLRGQTVPPEQQQAA